MSMRRTTLATLIWASCAGSTPKPVEPAAPATAPLAGTPTTNAAVVAPTPAVAMAPPKKLRSIEGITEYQLDNGLQVLLFPDATQSTFTINVTYKVGSRLEGYGETGMAHLLEHMMFKGSPRHRNVLKLLQEKGGQANGSTWYDRTNYFETLPASPENLDWAFDLESDRMIHAEVSAEDLKTEFSVVRNEFESDENNASGILDERVWSTAYLWHNYGKSTIGSRSDIERVPVPALRAFYEKYYQPDNAVVILAGKFDQAAALAGIVKTFGAIPRPARKLSDAYTVEPAQDGEREVALRRKGDVAWVELAYHGASGPTRDQVAERAAVDMMTRQPSGRLYKRLVETKLAATVSGEARAQHDPGLIQFQAQVRDAKNLDKVVAGMEAEIEGLATAKIDPKELERWRTATLKEIELAMGNSQEIAVILSEFIGVGDWRTWFAYRDQVKALTLDDVQRVAKLYLKSSNRTVGRFVPITGEPDRAPLTETANVADYVRDVKEGTVKDQGEQFAATLDNIEARTVRKQLAGGIKAAYLAKKTRGAKVHLELRLHWGDDKALQNRATAGGLLGPMMMRGTTKKSHQELKDLEDQLKAHLAVTSDASGLTIGIETTRENLPAVLDLAGEIVTQPSFPAKELEIVRQEAIAQLEEQLQDPGAVAFNELAHTTSKWPKSDPRYAENTAESIADLKKVQLAEVVKQYKEFAGAGHGELAVVGDFDPDATSAAVEKLFAGWQTKRPYKRLDNKPWGVPGSEKSIDLKDKEQTTLAIAFDVPMKDTDADYAPWLVASQVLGGYTGSRLWMRLREHEGLSYGVGTWSYAGSLDDLGGFGGYAIVAPQNLAKAKASMLEEFSRMASGQVAADELERAKDSWLKDQDTNLSNDDYQVEMLVGQLYRGRTTAFTKDLRAKLRAVTAADVERVAKKYYDPKRLTIIDAGDHGKAALK